MVACNFAESDIFEKADPILLALEQEVSLQGIRPVMEIPFQTKADATNGRCIFTLVEETETGIYYAFTCVVVDMQF